LLVTFIFLKYDFIIEVFIISTVLSFIVFLKVKKNIEQKIGGITGDILGLVAETSETTFLYIAYFTAKIIAFIISQ
jgi:cobalamin-5-phosphate synthase